MLAQLYKKTNLVVLQTGGWRCAIVATAIFTGDSLSLPRQSRRSHRVAVATVDETCLADGARSAPASLAEPETLGLGLACFLFFFLHFSTEKASCQDTLEKLLHNTPIISETWKKGLLFPNK
jgi:hypothetical protein